MLSEAGKSRSQGSLTAFRNARRRGGVFNLRSRADSEL